MSVNATIAKRYEGRLFVEDGRLHMVINVDTTTGMAHVSCNDGNGAKVSEWPVTEIGNRLSRTNGLMLDGLVRNDHSERITEKDDGWHFTSREGLKGPYDSEKKAEAALKEYILASQGEFGPRH